VELRDLLFGCVEPFRQEAALHGVQVVLETDHCLGRVHTDPAKLGHVVGNLISNAVKFATPTPEGFVEGVGEEGEAGARVVARAWRLEDGGWRLEVEDNGVGMPPEVAAHAFEEFYQGPQAQDSERNARSPRGRGLGLAIVARLCEAMGAEVALQSDPGQGSCFTLTFPQLAQSDQRDTAAG
jgi:signal transduction histidine kinase